jgi:hypothetical protein
MKNALFVLIISLPSITCAVGAILLALNGIAGWGWFLFIALISNPAALGLKITTT